MTGVRAALASDDGLTLVELLVYTVLLGVILGIVASIMISTQQVERLIRGSATAATSAQLAAGSITWGIRNATAMKLLDVGTDQLLLARVAGSDPSSVSYTCQAWYFASTARTIRHTATASDTVPVTPPAAEPTTWTLLATDVEAPSGSAFAVVGSELTISFDGLAADTAPTSITTSVAPRAAFPESASCF